MDVWLTETYFAHLVEECFENPVDRKHYDGCLRLLHDIPFYWTIWMDENRAGDALSFRQSDFLGYQEDLDSMDQVWLGNWACASPSVLEVLHGIARRWSMYFEDPPSKYFEIMFINLGLNKYPGVRLTTKSKEAIRDRVDIWMSRQFEPNGHGSPFPVHHAMDIIDMRQVDIWTQMNAYSAEHFQ